MKTWLFVVCSCLLFISFCAAQESSEYRACGDKAKSQAKMNACAAAEAKRADAELNRVYRELLLKAKNDAAVLSKIRAFQRAWIAYRDAYFNAAFPAANKNAAYGSTNQMNVCLLGAKLTREQTAALAALME